MIAIHGLGWKTNNADCDPTGKICLLARFWPAFAFDRTFQAGKSRPWQVSNNAGMGRGPKLLSETTNVRLNTKNEHFVSFCGIICAQFVTTPHDLHPNTSDLETTWGSQEGEDGGKVICWGAQNAACWWPLVVGEDGTIFSDDIWWQLTTSDACCWLSVYLLGDTIYTSIFWTEMSLST